ncbi:MAG: SLOG family protein [Pseudomonadota bacterium]
MRVLICGGREVDQSVLTAVREWVAANCSPGDVVIHRAARGVDTEAMHAAETKPGVLHSAFHADWEGLGRAAGPTRNKQMLDEGCPDLVVAFPGGRGTANMVKQAQASGVEVLDKRED